MNTTRTCPEALLARAWASAYYRQPANYLRLLIEVLDEIGTMKVYARIGRRALDSGMAQQIDEATRTLQTEVDRRQRARQQVREAFPLLHRALLSRAA